MAWQLESTKQYVGFTNIRKNGKSFDDWLEYTLPLPHLNCAHVELPIWRDTSALIVMPYSVMHLKNKVKLIRGNDTIDALVAGIRDEASLSYFAYFYKIDGRPFDEFKQFFFKDNQPSGYQEVQFNLPAWPSNLQTPINEEMYYYLRELKELYQQAAKSIDACAIHLLRNGPEYAQGDTSIKTELDL